MFRTSAMVICGALVFVLALLACEEDEGECRIYLANDGSGTFHGLYVVDSPEGQNGDWGPDLIVTEPEEYINGDWRVFRFTDGRTLDLLLEYTVSWGSGEANETGKKCRDGQGIKYEISGGNMFTTRFNFD